jgi:hypothetical protein
VTAGWRRSYARGATGPYLYAQRSSSFVHCGVRRFREEWQSGWSVWLTLVVRGRYLVMWRKGAAS